MIQVTLRTATSVRLSRTVQKVHLSALKEKHEFRHASVLPAIMFAKFERQPGQYNLDAWNRLKVTDQNDWVNKDAV